MEFLATKVNSRKCLSNNYCLKESALRYAGVPKSTFGNWNRFLVLESFFHRNLLGNFKILLSLFGSSLFISYATHVMAPVISCLDH